MERIKNTLNGLAQAVGIVLGLLVSAVQFFHSLNAHGLEAVALFAMGVLFLMFALAIAHDVGRDVRARPVHRIAEKRSN